jgi:hypothetical protein
MQGVNKWIFELVCRWYIFIFLNYYGLGKIAGMQFYRKGKLPVDVAELTLGSADAFSLAWTFMGYSFHYILFIGLLQIVGAWLLLWNKTKFAGVFILIPIMANIIVFDIIFLEKKGATVNATIYFLMLLSILAINKNQIINAYKIISNERISKKITLNTIFKVLLIMVIVFMIDQLLVGLVGR